MAFLSPLALFLALLAAPLVLLYMLRLRRRPVTVSSTLLWQRLLRDREANAPWQRLRRQLLLFLQLLILLALVFALARPFFPVPALVSGNLVVLVDGSASMRATDASPTRFVAAQQAADRLIGRLSGGDQMTLILAGARPEVLAAATNDRGLLSRALAEASPGYGEADWAGALALAAGAAQGFREARVVVLSDGGLPAGLPPLPVEVMYIPIGERDENLAISALATRQTATGTELFARVSNYGMAPQTALFSLRLDDALFDSRRLQVPANGASHLTWTLPPDAGAIRASLGELEADFLAEDNVAWAISGSGVQRRALLVTAGNLFLEQAFAVLPGIAAFKSDPGIPLAAEEAFDLLVFDSVSPPAPLPAGDLLLVNPPTSVPDLLEVGGTFTNTFVLQVDDSPLLQYVDWSRVSVREARRVVAPWARTLVAGEGGPLLLAGATGGRRVAVLTFAVRDSDLPLQVAFPILLANLTDFLVPGQAAQVDGSLASLTPVPLIPPAGTIAVAVTRPDGTVWRAAVGSEPVVFTDTALPGPYAITAEDATGVRPAGGFAVNLFAPAESRLAPATALALSQDEPTDELGEDVGQWELWPWLAGIALMVLGVEWWVHHRGARWPRLARGR